MNTHYLGVIDGIRVWEVVDEAGNVIGRNEQPVEADPPVITGRQLKLWLVRHGYTLAAVAAAIDAIPDQQTREVVRVEWECVTDVSVHHPWVVALASALGISDVNSAFTEAACM